MHREHVAVRRVPGRRGRAAEVLHAVVVADVERPLGSPEPPVPATPVSSWVTEAGMPSTIQCQNPEPVGASGSKQVTAKLLVSAGKPDQYSDGEMFPPVMPHPS